MTPSFPILTAEERAEVVRLLRYTAVCISFRVGLRRPDGATSVCDLLVYWSYKRHLRTPEQEKLLTLTGNIFKALFAPANAEYTEYWMERDEEHSPITRVVGHGSPRRAHDDRILALLFAAEYVESCADLDFEPTRCFPTGESESSNFEPIDPIPYERRQSDTAAENQLTSTMPTPTPEDKNATASRTDKAVVCDALVLRPKIGFFRHLVRGCGTLPHCGEHPGTMWLVMFALMGAMAGAKGGLIGALGGAGIMLAVFGSVYLVGAYDRSKTDECIDRQNSELSGDTKKL